MTQYIVKCKDGSHHWVSADAYGNKNNFFGKPIIVFRRIVDNKEYVVFKVLENNVDYIKDLGTI